MPEKIIKEQKQALPKTDANGCFLVGQKIPISGGYLKIMAYADDYYMARFKGCIPFCCRQDELIRRIKMSGDRKIK